MIKSIIFSKNRPLQLDLTLSSIKKNFLVDNQITVLYYADDEYKSSYETLKSEHPDVNFVYEDIDLFTLIINEIKTSNQQYIVFFTDDIIFYRKYHANLEILNLHSDNIACLSLRVGKNILYRNAEIGIADILPNKVDLYDNHLFWDRLSIPPGGYWSYALSVDGHIFKKDKILEIICYVDKIAKQIEKCKSSPNKLEELMQMFFFRIGPIMISPEESCIVNSPNNRVQDVILNKAGTKFSYCESELNKLFQQGKRLSLEEINLLNPNLTIICPHQEIRLL